MPKAYFRFPGGASHSIDETLAGTIPAKLLDMYPMAYYQAAAEDRVWKGKPSVSGISSSGARETFLRYTVPYAVDLDGYSNAFAGQVRHSRFEQDIITHELPVSNEDISGRLDNLELRPNGELWLIDYKLVGSYSYRMFKGISMEAVQSVDEYGTPLFYKSGQKKGQAVTHKVPVAHSENADTKKYLRQLNLYRYLVERELEKDIPGLEHLKGRKIDRMMVFFQIRDGGVKAAAMNGIENNIYLEEIPPVSDEKVEDFIQRKGGAITDAVNKYLEDHDAFTADIPALIATAPEICDSYDCWEGRKCREYCPVADFCSRLGDNPHLGG